MKSGNTDVSDTAEAGTAPILAVAGNHATLRLNRPRHLNKLTAGDLACLWDALQRIETDPAVRVLTLTGTGRAFSAGYDLGDIASRLHQGTNAVPQARHAGPTFEAVCDRLEDIAVPTICLLNGGVYGGATDLALACDFRIGVDTCELFMPAARLGLHYYTGGMQRYVTRLGLSAAKKLFLTAQKIDAREMLKIGYLDETVSAPMLHERGQQLAATIAANAPIATRGMKRTLNEIARNTLDGAAADQRHHESFASDELREGSAAFAERRAPRF